jgi:hypothetical protein
MMAEHGDPKDAARPIVAGQAKVARKRPAVRLRSGQHVVLVERFEHVIQGLALLGGCCLLGDLVVSAVEIVDVLRERAKCAVLTPPPQPTSGSVDQRPAEVPTLAGTDAGDE